MPSLVSSFVRALHKVFPICRKDRSKTTASGSTSFDATPGEKPRLTLQPFNDSETPLQSLREIPKGDSVTVFQFPHLQTSLASLKDSVWNPDDEAISDVEQPLVAIIGVGYVGFHLVEAFSPQYRVIAYDVSERQLKSQARRLETSDPQKAGNVTWTGDAVHLATATHFLIAVPTLLLPNKQINTAYLESAISTVAQHARRGSTIVMESSVAVGMTRQMLATLAQARDLKVGMSPERVDPGRRDPPVENIPKIISGLDDVAPGSLHSIHGLYSRVFKTVVPVSRPEVAEMMKLYENCQRMVCIAYVNEMADACLSHNIDPLEVCSAASSKPFGYMPYTPGLGVGGSCIPINPYYLLTNNEFPLLQLATQRMWERPAWLGSRTMTQLMASRSGDFKDRRPRVLLCGVGFKAGQSVVGNCPGIEYLRNLRETWDADVSFMDSLVDQAACSVATKIDHKTQWNISSLKKFDLIVVSHKQKGVDFGLLDVVQKLGVQVETWCS